MKRIGVAFLLLSLGAVSLSAGGWKKSVTEAKAEAKKNGQLVFVDLFAEWCGWCHRMEREVFPSEKFQQATRNMVLLRVDIEDGGEGTRLARQYSITKLPTFLLVTPDDLLAGVIYGYAPSDEFAKRVSDSESKFLRFKEEVSKEQTFQKDFARREALAAAFISRNGYLQGEKRLTALLREESLPVSVRDMAYYHLAYSQMSRKSFAEAKVTLKKFFSVQNEGEYLERSRVLMGQVYFEEGNYKASLEELRSFKRDFPKSALLADVNTMLPKLERTVGSN